MFILILFHDHAITCNSRRPNKKPLAFGLRNMRILLPPSRIHHFVNEIFHIHVPTPVFVKDTEYFFQLFVRQRAACRCHEPL